MIEGILKVKVIHSCPALCEPIDCPCNSPGQNAGVGSLSLFQEIFPTQGSNPGLPHCKQILYQLSYQGSPLKYNTLIIFNSLSIEVILDKMIKEASFIMREMEVYLGTSNPFLYSPIPHLGTLCRNEHSLFSERVQREKSPGNKVWVNPPASLPQAIPT